jgi:type 1 glutamine amidotransferase
MNKILFVLYISFIVLTVNETNGKSLPPKYDLIKVLILSGKNNHEWQKTTPLLYRIFKDSKLFSINITDQPDTLSYKELKKYNLIISNWNSWPDNIIRLSGKWESDYMRFVNEGGGVLSFHAGASSFYDWEAYHRIGIGRWGKDTRHGPVTLGKVYGFDQKHPVTKGISEFYIMDEIWENSDIYPGSTAIGSLSATDGKDGHPINTPAVFVSKTGKGRTFFTTLGHDERALLNSGLQILLLRAAQWCAGKEVTIEVPSGMKKVKNWGKDQFSWAQTDTSLTLRNHSETVWQYNFNNRFGKPYFHPITVNHSVLTCVSPPDHPWHLGLWYSWKYINGVNYWEYTDKFRTAETGYKSDGITEIIEKEIKANTDFSSKIVMKINYHPINGNTVLSEERILSISCPFTDGSYLIDEEHLFKAMTDSVKLDRTPVIGEPGGQSWGGYAGLSVRFNEDFTAPGIISLGDSTKCKKCKWMYMGFNNLAGEKAGIAILTNPQFTTNSTSWYVISDQKIPFYYYSPAILFDNKIVLKKAELLRLKYRIWILPGIVSKENLEEKSDQYLNK